MLCICGHSAMFHTPHGKGPCDECDECPTFRPDPNYEPPDPEGWEGGFADNH